MNPYRDSGELCLIGARMEMQNISDYAWEGPRHLKEAIKVFISAHLDANESGESFFGRFTPKERQEVELLLAGNPMTSPRVLDYLSRRTTCTRTLERIAANPKTALQTLEDLLEHPEQTVRAAIAGRENLQDSLVWCLVADKSADVRLTLAESPLLPKLILALLAQDENPFVADRAQASLRRSHVGSVCVDANFRLDPKLRIISA